MQNRGPVTSEKAGYFIGNDGFFAGTGQYWLFRTERAFLEPPNQRQQDSHQN